MIGVGITAFNVTVVVPAKVTVQPVIGFVANTDIVRFEEIGAVVMLITPPVPATTELIGVAPSYS
jgi:hypothetical protein